MRRAGSRGGSRDQLTPAGPPPAAAAVTRVGVVAVFDVGTGQTVVAGREGAIAAESTAMHVSGGLSARG